jgi:hypothetical protein
MVLTMSIEIALIAMIVAATAFRMGAARRVKVRANHLTPQQQREIARRRASGRARQYRC